MKQLTPLIIQPLLLIALCLTAACQKKDPDPLIEGRVLEYGTEIPIKNALIKLRSYDGEFLGPISSSVVDTEVADENGYFSMPYPDRNVLRINAIQNGYFSDDFSEVAVTKAYDEDIHLHPYAWIRVKIRNESGAYSFGSSLLLGQNISPLIIQGAGKDSTVLKLLKGNLEQKIIFYIQQSPGTPLSDFTNLKAFDANGQNMPIDQNGALNIHIKPSGHDTTDIFIIY